GAWHGKSVAQTILAYLYSGLSLACLGKSFYGSVILLDIWLSFHLKIDYRAPDTKAARSYERSSISKISTALHYTNSMVVKTWSCILELNGASSWLTYTHMNSSTAQKHSKISNTKSDQPKEWTFISWEAQSWYCTMRTVATCR